MNKTNNILKDKFIVDSGTLIKRTEYEAQKEENFLIVIDLYGDEKKLIHQFENRYYCQLLYNTYTQNNHFLHKCCNCHKIFSNWRFN